MSALAVGQLLAQRPETVNWLALVAALGCGAAVAALPRASLLALIGLAVAIAILVTAFETPVFASFVTSAKSGGVVGVAVMIAAFTLARYPNLGGAIAGYTILMAGAVAIAAPEVARGAAGALGLIYVVFYFGVAGTLGWLARKRAEHVLSIVVHAESLEREQEQRAQLVAAAERERMARDMHDVVSHGVSVMVLQAEAAREVLSSRPEAAATALDAIAEAGRTAMTDLHRMLRVLRGPDLDLGALVASVCATGLRVDLQIDGDWAGVDGAIREALYRVAQESLTNTMRHASGATQASIRVTCNADVTMTISDDGRGETGSTEGVGSGLIGLADRLATLGGTLATGHRTDATGFQVVASVPGSRT